MSKIIAAIGTAFVTIGDALLESLGAAPDDSPASSPPKEASGDAPTPRRGRPPKSTEPAQTAAPADVEKERARLREIYLPLVEAGKGEVIRPIISKYSPGGMDSMKPSDFPAFEKDIQALLL